jgi:hypothetical protein
MLRFLIPWASIYVSDILECKISKVLVPSVLGRVRMG